MLKEIWNFFVFVGEEEYVCPALGPQRGHSGPIQTVILKWRRDISAWGGRRGPSLTPIEWALIYLQRVLRSSHNTVNYRLVKVPFSRVPWGEHINYTVWSRRRLILESHMIVHFHISSLKGHLFNMNYVYIMCIIAQSLLINVLWIRVKMFSLLSSPRCWSWDGFKETT